MTHTFFFPVRGDSTFIHLVPTREHGRAGHAALCGTMPPEMSRGARWRTVGAPSEKTCNACFALASAVREGVVEWSKP